MRLNDTYHLPSYPSTRNPFSSSEPLRLQTLLAMLSTAIRAVGLTSSWNGLGNCGEGRVLVSKNEVRKGKCWIQIKAVGLRECVDIW